MKKIFIITAFLLFAPFFNARALTITVIDDKFIERYAGSIILEDNVFQKKIWYLEPVSKKRYLVSDVNSLKKITDQFAQKTKTTILNKIPNNQKSKNIDYNVVKKYSGQFLIDSNSQELWYINPLDLIRYKITIDDVGLHTLDDLAIGLSLDKLSIVDVAENEKISTEKKDVDFNKYNELRQLLKDSYYKEEKLDDQKLFYGSLAGLAAALDDPYTEFFSPQGKQEFVEGIDNTVEGIGTIVDLKNGILTIIAPIIDSPAMKAGLLPNDQILEVDGVSLRGFTTKKGTALIKGPKGTPVKLKIHRPDNNQTFEIIIIRDKISVPNVNAKQLDNNIAYFSINTFAQDTVAEFNSLRQKYVNSSTKGIVIDLRNNPGGYTSSAIGLADIWLPANTLVMQEKTKSKTINYYTNTEETLKIPTVILINSGTASASEIFTLALRENNSAKIVGQTSYGKGTGQILSEFSDGSALKYTYFEWFTGLNKSIENRGITPDIEIKNDNKLSIDSQLGKALEILK